MCVQGEYLKQKNDNNFVVPKQAIRYECTRDYDCATDQACVQRACVNPCATENCASSALCHVQNHSPICRCPQGQVGDPRVECRFPEPRKPPFSSNTKLSIGKVFKCVNNALLYKKKYFAFF